MIKIAQYQRIHISSRTAARYCRLHRLQSSGGHLVFRYLWWVPSHSEKCRQGCRWALQAPPRVFKKKKKKDPHSPKKAAWGATISLSPRVLGPRLKEVHGGVRWSLRERREHCAKLIRQRQLLLRGVALTHDGAALCSIISYTSRSCLINV